MNPTPRRKGNAMLFDHEDDNPVKVLTADQSWSLLGQG
jgi:hypothetical protein